MRGVYFATKPLVQASINSVQLPFRFDLTYFISPPVGYTRTMLTVAVRRSKLLTR